MAVKNLVQTEQTGGNRFRWTREAYHRLYEMGFIGPEERTELIFGEIFYKMGQNPLHSFCLMISPDVFRQAFGEGTVVRSQLPIVLAEDGEPEPDICVVRGQVRDFVKRQPDQNDVLLIVEVSDSTLTFDQTRKASLYAQAGIADYWIINLVDRRIEVRRNPGPSSDSPTGFAYSENRSFVPGQSISPLALTGKFILVNDILPVEERDS